MFADAEDIRVMRDLAAQYAEVAGKPIQEERRRLWSDHHSLVKTRPLVLATYGMWNVWCREVFGDHAMKCRNGFLREHERWLRMQLFHDTLGDDFILEPWITQWAHRPAVVEGCWGLPVRQHATGAEGGAYTWDPPLKHLGDLRSLIPPRHVIDDGWTRGDVEKLQEAVGDALTVNVDRGPAGYRAEFSLILAWFRGMGQMMFDMVDEPGELHRLLAFLRDGTLAELEQAELAGDLGLTNHRTQEMPYSRELPWPRANALGRRRKELWCHAASQEFTLVSPAMHQEFLLQYQLPILESFGLVTYGCCEDLTQKIDMLRTIPNLRTIAVAPRADVRRCAEQIGTDYVMSWRPDPGDMIGYGFDEGRIRRILRDGLRACRGCHVHMHLKDIETVEGDLSRLLRWVRIAREAAEEAA